MSVWLSSSLRASMRPMNVEKADEPRVNVVVARLRQGSADHRLVESTVERIRGLGFRQVRLVAMKLRGERGPNTGSSGASGINSDDSCLPAASSDPLARPPRRTVRAPMSASRARSSGGTRSQTPREGVHE